MFLRPIYNKKSSPAVLSWREAFSLWHTVYAKSSSVYIYQANRGRRHPGNLRHWGHFHQFTQSRLRASFPINLTDWNLQCICIPSQQGRRHPGSLRHWTSLLPVTQTRIQASFQSTWTDRKIKAYIRASRDILSDLTTRTLTFDGSLYSTQFGVES